jgi:5-methylcytosine-specific restriction endonuclease McrA
MKIFDFREDKQYFIDILCEGNEKEFEQFFLPLFDFRSPLIKRRELNVELKKQELLQEHNTCQLRVSPDCTGTSNLQVEHLIPISTNKLNKIIRKVKAEPGKKVPTQSFGSNNISNLTLACNNCNSLKKHRLPDEFPEVVELIRKRVLPREK